MNFKFKNLLQQIFSVVPKGELLNYFFQVYITKSFPPDDATFVHKSNMALLHYRNFNEYNRIEKKTGNYYEFGAGATLSIPLIMSHLGFNVYCIDIRKLIFPMLIRDSFKKLRVHHKMFPFDVKQTNIDGVKSSELPGFLKREFNLTYLAPMDARKTDFEDNFFDLISSTVVLEHIPQYDILAILNECYRILNTGGVLSLRIDYQDHYSYFDSSVSIYNFLQYTDKEWNKYNPSLHYQNRLRHSDYLELIAQTGFKIVKDVPRKPTHEHMQALGKVKLSEKFAHKHMDDLAVPGSEIVLIKWLN
jgi:SAM-dependent methyltransferase